MSCDNRCVLSVLGVLLAAGVAVAQTPLRVATWNVTNYSSSNPDARNASFQAAVYGVVPSGPLAGLSMSPDVLICSEFMSATSATQFRNLLNSAVGSPGDWVAAPFRDGNDTDSMFFFRSTRVEFLDRFGNAVPIANLTNPAIPTGNAVNSAIIIAPGASSSCSQPRHTMRYDFRPIGYSGVGANIGSYSLHLKAQGSNAACGSGGENAAGRRLNEAQRIRANAAGIDTNGAGTALPAGYNFMYAGDTNIQTSGSPEYQAFIAASISGYPDVTSPFAFITQTITGGRVFDPIRTPGSWNNNSSFRFVHTQEPASQMDDRHDQILLSAGLLDGLGMDYIGSLTLPYSTTTWNDPNHSYRSWGNDGTSYNGILSNGIGGRPTNGMVGNPIATALITSVGAGGHLPVFVDMRVPPKVGVNFLNMSFGTVNVGDAATRTLSVANLADVARWSAAGIGNLVYTLTTTSGFTAPGGTFTRVAGAAALDHVLNMNTATTGVKSGTVTISAPQAVDTPIVIITLTGTVVNPPPPVSCFVDYNADGFLNQEDLSGYISAFLDESVPAGPSGTSIAPCAGEPVPYDTLGYAADYNRDCSFNQEDLSGFITEYLLQTESPDGCVPG